MQNNKYIPHLSRTSILLVFALLMSINLYAVKKSAAEINNPQEASTIVDKKEKPHFLQRVGLKIFSKRLQQKVKKYKENTTEQSKLKKGLAVAALVLGILAFLTSIVGIVLAILAVIFGALALKRIREEPELYGGRKMAIAGLVLGIVLLGISILVLFIVAAGTLGLFFI